MSTSTQSPGAPFGAMLRGASLPSAVAGGIAGLALVLTRGPGALAGVGLGLAVSIGFFGSGMLLMSRLVRTASPGAFLAVAMAVYFGQVIALLLFLLAFKDAAWVDGQALGLVALVVTLVWQVFAMRALRNARVLVYDEPTT